MRIAICDDDREFVTTLCNHIHSYFTKHNITTNIYLFYSGEDIILSNNIYDLIIMDYQMQGLDGIQTAAKIRTGINEFTFIIFLTQYPEIAISAYKVDTYRFVVKNTLYGSLYSAFDDYRKAIKFDKDLRICTNRGFSTVSTEDIVFIESRNKIVILNLSNGTQISTYRKLSELSDVLPSAYFVQIHKSFVVNMRRMSSYINTEVKVVDVSLPISKRFSKTFKNKYTVFLRDTR